MTTPAHSEWLSAYLHFTGDIYGPACDTVVLDVVAPFVERCISERWIDRYFYIRYNEEGAHVRLRLSGDRQKLLTTVQPALQDFANGATLRESYSARNKSRHGTAAVSHIRRIAYEPEIERYGGEYSMAVAEDVFRVTSDTAIALLGAIDLEDRSSRLGRALLATLVLVATFYRDRRCASRFAARYSASYLAVARGGSKRGGPAPDAVYTASYTRQADSLVGHIDEVWARLSAREDIDSILDELHRRMLLCHDDLHDVYQRRRVRIHGVNAQSWDQCTDYIVPSYVHMMNNRFGVSIAEETYIASLLSRALSADAVGNDV